MDEDDRLAGRRPAQGRPGDRTTRTPATCVKFVQAYTAAGVPIDYLSVQNEPQNRTPVRLPRHRPAGRASRSTVIDGARAAAAQRQPAHEDPRRTTTTGPRTRTTSPPRRPARTRRPTTRTRSWPSPAAKWVAGTAYHCYFGDPSAQTALHDAYPDKGIWFTECSGSHGPTDPPAKFFRDTLVWHARNIAIGTTRNWARSVVNWNIALDPRRRPAPRRLRHLHRPGHRAAGRHA